MSSKQSNSNMCFVVFAVSRETRHYLVNMNISYAQVFIFMLSVTCGCHRINMLLRKDEAVVHLALQRPRPYHRWPSMEAWKHTAFLFPAVPPLMTGGHLSFMETCQGISLLVVTHQLPHGS